MKDDTPGQLASGPSKAQSSRGSSAEEEDSDDEIGPRPPPQNGQTSNAGEEPEYDPSDFEDDDEEASEFPITHEIVLKDHTKVVSALALDPSGARIVSGSHDYDCKLWDFGGMDMRCKPFKSWEPAGSYHVRISFFCCLLVFTYVCLLDT